MPTKLVIKGVEPGTPLAGAVADHFGGRLKQFHVKQQQNYALSPTEIHRSHIEWKGGRATYVNQGGQEYLTLEVDPQLLKELHEKHKTLPDYAVVDFVVQGSQNNRPQFTAALIAPHLDRAAVTYLDVPINGVEINAQSVVDYSNFTRDPIIDFPDYSLATGYVAISNYVASLKIDFRKLGDTAMVVVDVYATIDADPDTIENLAPVFLGYTRYPDYSTHPPTYYGCTVSPGDLYIGSDPNQACVTLVKHVTSYTKFAGQPQPQTVSVMDGVEYYGDGSQQIAPTCLSFFYDIYEAPYNYSVPPAGYVDQFSHNTIYDETHQATHYVVGLSFTLTVDPAFAARGYVRQDEQEIRRLQNVISCTKRPAYDYPSIVINHPAKKQVDIAFSFYEAGTKFYADGLNNLSYVYDAIWVTRENTVPSRTTLVLKNPLVLSSTDTPDPWSVDNPYSLKQLGRLVLDRATRSIAFKPT